MEQIRKNNYYPPIYTTNEGRMYKKTSEFFNSQWFKDELPKLKRFATKFIKKQNNE